jgi:hypothetical protein
LIDADFTKTAALMTREWYMHPNGQLPAYEWAGDVNPGTTARRAYKVEMKRRGRATEVSRASFQVDAQFTWWVNRKDADGRNVFQGGFLTSTTSASSMQRAAAHRRAYRAVRWHQLMGMYCLNMLAIALELAIDNSATRMSPQILRALLYISYAMNNGR